MKRILGNFLSVGGFLAFMGLLAQVWIESKSFTTFSMSDFIESITFVLLISAFILFAIGMGILTSVPKHD